MKSALSNEIADMFYQYPFTHTAAIVLAVGCCAAGLLFSRNIALARTLIIIGCSIALVVSVTDELQTYLFREQGHGATIIMDHIIVFFIIPPTNTAIIILMFSMRRAKNIQSLASVAIVTIILHLACAIIVYDLNSDSHW
jgi:hypothetical protein